MKIVRRFECETIDAAIATIMQWVRDLVRRGDDMDYVTFHFICRSGNESDPFQIMTFGFENMESHRTIAAVIQMIKALRPVASVAVNPVLRSGGEVTDVQFEVQRSDGSVQHYRLASDSDSFVFEKNEHIKDGEPFPLTYEGWEMAVQAGEWSRSLEFA